MWSTSLRKLSSTCCIGRTRHHAPAVDRMGTPYKGAKIRKLRMAPLGNKAAFLSVEIHRLKCSICDLIWWPPLPFARPKKRFTISFERYVIELMRFATIEHAAKFLGVSWGLVKDVHKDYLMREYQEPDLKSIRDLGVDEISIRKGHEYMTNFINLETGEIIHSVEGKSIECVTPFILQLKEKAILLKAIAIDMNAAYASATKKYLPNVDVVFDRFHVVALLIFWTKQSVKEGAQFLCWWIMDAVESGIRELEKTGRTLLGYGNDLLNYFKHRITNGKTEGINNKIKTMMRQAYGFRDMEYFKLSLYNLHKAGYSFVR